MARGEFPSSKQDQFVLRFPDGLRDRVKEKAEANGRSMNAEIVAAIESAIDMPDLNASDLRRMLDEERAMSARTETMMETQFELLSDYKGILKTANAQNSQQASIIRSLCSIVLSLDPGPEVIDLMERIAQATEGMVKLAKDTALVEGARAEVREVDKIIARADEILKRKDD